LAVTFPAAFLKMPSVWEFAEAGKDIGERYPSVVTCALPLELFTGTAGVPPADVPKKTAGRLNLLKAQRASARFGAEVEQFAGSSDLALLEAGGTPAVPVRSSRD
jgi:hypothetical protein